MQALFSPIPSIARGSMMVPVPSSELRGRLPVENDARIREGGIAAHSARRNVGTSIRAALVSAVQGVGRGGGEGEKETDGDGSLGRLTWRTLMRRRRRDSGRDLSATESVSCVASGTGASLSKARRETEGTYQLVCDVDVPRISVVNPVMGQADVSH